MIPKKLNLKSQAGNCAIGRRRASQRWFHSLLAANLAAWLFMLAAPPSSLGLTASALQDQTCAGFRAGGNLNCTAGEFTVAPVFSAAPGTSPFCVAGQSFSFQVDLGISGTNADRYNIGFFTGQQGNDPTATTAGNICSVATFPTAPSPWVNLDSNACGDFLSGGNQTTTVNQIKVLCQGDSTGALQIPYVVTYSQSSGACTGPTDVTNGSPSKCNAGASAVSGTVTVYSGAYVDVTKQTAPDGDSQPFTFTASGPSGSKVIALTGAILTPTTATGGTYTPATIALTNSTTVTLADGQTARFYINALAAGRLLTITEAATTNWESTASISCAAVTGSPALATDPANRTINATLSATDSAAACTVTNTKRSRITLQKSVAGRINISDQFRVSASGGGTLTGTTTATTSGVGTAASTTFYSTPGTALTLTDAMVSGVLSSYDARLTCTNAFAGPGATSNASLPNNQRTTSTSITPAPGDDITCTYTNTPGLTITKAFSPTTIFAGDTSDITFTIRNNLAAAKTFTLKDDTIDAPAAWPAGMTVAPAAVSKSCIGGNLMNFDNSLPLASETAANRAKGFQLVASSVPGDSTCTLILTVTAPLAGTYINQTSGAFPAGASPASNIATLTAINRPPTITELFNPSPVDSYTTSTMTFTLTNPNGSTLTAANFTDTLTGFSVDAPATIGGTCAGVTNSPALVAGATSLNLTVPNLTPGSCTITIPVSSTTAGVYTNATSGITTTQTSLGVVSNTATLTVNWLPLQVTKSPSVTTTSPGAFVTYTIGYGNPNATAKLQNIVITDPVPLYTAYNSASCGPLPATITTCNIVFTAPPAGVGNGIVTWTLGGALDAQKNGFVLLTVRIQ